MRTENKNDLVSSRALLDSPDSTDHSPAAELRRDVLDLARELGVDLGNGSGGGSGGGSGNGSGGGDPEPRLARPDASLDVRGSTPVALLRASRALAGALRRRERSSEGRGLLLLEVGRAGGIAAVRLGRALGIGPPALSSLLRRAARDGLIATRSDAQGRIRHVRLTRAGRASAERAAASCGALDERLLDTMTAGERDDLRRLLRKARQALDRGGAAT